MNGHGLDTRVPGSKYFPCTSSGYKLPGRPTDAPTGSEKIPCGGGRGEKREREREKEGERGRRMKKGETRIGNEGRDKGSTVMVVR